MDGYNEIMNDTATRPRSLAFTKMQGVGNDFVVIEAAALDRPLASDAIRRLADRRLGVGCDQVLVIDTSASPFAYRIFNADGGEVGQCGNGARCLARYVADRGLDDGPEIQLSSTGGPVSAHVGDDAVSIELDVPRFDPAQIPFIAPEAGVTYTLDVDGEPIEIGAVSLGNPHAVIGVDSIDSAPVTQLGPLIENHPRFPERANVGFLEIVDEQHCRLRVFERGVGETRACGTGATAAAVWGRLCGRLAERVTVSLAGGDLEVTWPGPGKPAWLTGPAVSIFEGRITL